MRAEPSSAFDACISDWALSSAEDFWETACKSFKFDLSPLTREETVVKAEATEAPTAAPTANVTPKEVPMKTYQELMAKQYASWWPLFVPVAAIAACIDKWFLDAASWPEAAGHGVFAGLCFMALVYAGKAVRPFPWVIPVAAAVTCARKWFFSAPTWTAPLDAGLVTAFVLLVVLHLMKGSR